MALLDFENAYQRVGGVDQIESHGVLSPIDMVLRFLLIFFNAGLMIGVSLEILQYTRTVLVLNHLFFLFKKSMEL
jgi:hypothetical protein